MKTSSYIARQVELSLFIALLGTFNFPLLHGAFAGPFVYLPTAVRDGEWWRLLTHPFVHVSWYHLLLDGGAFVLLYRSLRVESCVARLVVVAASAAGSLLAPLLVHSEVEWRGLCGLSGIAHGLMAFSALEMIKQKRVDVGVFRVGLISLGLVTGKSLIEAITGKAMFGFLYFGLLGTPIAVCHLGGVVSGVILFTAMNWTRVAAVFGLRASVGVT